MALSLLRLTIAYTLWNYDFRFAPYEDGSRSEGKNQVILKAGPVDCVFTKRATK